MEYSGVGGKLIHEKNQKQKISWHCPFQLGAHCDSMTEKETKNTSKQTVLNLWGEVGGC